MSSIYALSAIALVAALFTQLEAFVPLSAVGKRTSFVAKPLVFVSTEVTAATEVNGLAGTAEDTSSEAVDAAPSEEAKHDAVGDVKEEMAPSIAEDEDKPQRERGERRKIKRDRFTLYVGNLPFDMSEDQLKELFAPKGKVELVSIPRRDGQPRGFAFVDMASAEEMEACIEAFDGTSVDGRDIRVTRSVAKEELDSTPRSRPERETRSPRGAPASPPVSDGNKKLYVGNIPFDVSKEEIEEFYAPHGKVVDVFIPSKDGRGRGFAFVTLKEEDIANAIQATNGAEFGGRRLVVSEPLPPGEKAPERTRGASSSNRVKLYVGNLSFYTVPDTLLELFQEFGTVHDCYMPEDDDGGRRGFGFVTMDRDAAMEAIAELDGVEVDGRMIRVNESQPKRFDRND